MKEDAKAQPSASTIHCTVQICDCCAWLIAAAMLVSANVQAATEQSDKPRAKVERDARSGNPRLVVSGPAGKPVQVKVSELCHYDPESDRWSRKPFRAVNKVVRSGVVTEITDQAGLYWIKWTENGLPFASLVHSGPVLCNDILMSPSPRSDVVRACIPLKNSAKAAYVPDPRIYCNDVSPARK